MISHTKVFVLIATFATCFSPTLVFGEEQKSEKLIPGFTNESKIGIVVITGNSRSQTYDLSQRDNYEWSGNKLGFLGSYLRATAKGVESARRWTLGLRYDRMLADRWSFFLAQTVEGDSYAGFLQRYSSDGGGKYFVIKDDANTWFFEGGYRFQSENQITGDQKKTSLARLFSQYEYRWNAAVSSKLWVEYLQNMSKSEDRYLNTEVSVRAALTNIFSVQLAYLVRYRNLIPDGVEFKTDTTLTAAVLAQF